jgi:hypothetical protein
VCPRLQLHVLRACHLLQQQQLLMVLLLLSNLRALGASRARTLELRASLLVS